MQIVFENFDWIGLNLTLALLGLVFGWLFYYAKRGLFSVIFFMLWVLFIPNTIYLITDLQHLPKQWVSVDLLVKPILIVQYGAVSFFGIVTFIVGMYPVEKVFKKLPTKNKDFLKFMILLFANLFIAFALILGKFQRTHSWYVVTDFPRFLTDIITVFQTPILLILVLFFGVVINLTYFGFKNVIQVVVQKSPRDKMSY